MKFLKWHRAGKCWHRRCAVTTAHHTYCKQMLLWQDQIKMPYPRLSTIDKEILIVGKIISSNVGGHWLCTEKGRKSQVREDVYGQPAKPWRMISTVLLSPVSKSILNTLRIVHTVVWWLENNNSKNIKMTSICINAFLMIKKLCAFMRRHACIQGGAKVVWHLIMIGIHFFLRT